MAGRERFEISFVEVVTVTDKDKSFTRRTEFKAATGQSEADEARSFSAKVQEVISNAVISVLTSELTKLIVITAGTITTIFVSWHYRH